MSSSAGGPVAPLWAALRYYWRSALAVALASAITTAVLTGALLVGDSVRGSLRQVTLERLGEIDHALLAESFFREELAADLASDPELAEVVDGVAPAILLQGAARHPETGRLASGVGIQGIDERFAALFPAYVDRLDLERGEDRRFPSLIVNRRLAEALEADVGSQVILQLERPSDVPRDTLLGETDPSSVLRSLRLELTGVLPDRGPGRFSLMPHQDLPSVAWVDLAVLQDALDQPGRVNAVLVSEAGQGAVARSDDGEPTVPDAVRMAVRRHLELDDLGLEVEQRPSADPGGAPGVWTTGSREILLRPGLADALRSTAEARGLPRLPVSTYLANRVDLLDGDGTPISEGEEVRGGRGFVPWSTIAALPTEESALEPFGELRLLDGSPTPALGPGEMLINEWAAEDLRARPGDRVRLTYYRVGDRERLLTESEEFEVVGTVALEGLGAAADLTPDFPGIADADDMSDWDPTFPVDLGWIRERDETYWDLYRGTPKFFVAPEVGERLWSTRHGWLSSIWVAPPDLTAVGEWQTSLDRLPGELALETGGMALQPVKARGLEASAGATPFEWLFLGFSMFLIASSALLVALFFRLAVEGRVREIGLRLAVGFPVASVRRTLLEEGLLLGGLGALAGLAGAVLYAAIVMWALRTVWIGATGTAFLELHVVPWTLPIGLVASMAVVGFAIWRAVARLAELPAPSLLRGVVRTSTRSGGGRARTVAAISAIVAVLLLVAQAWVGQSVQAALFFGIGAALLVCGLALFALWLGRERVGDLEAGLVGAARIAGANAGLHPGRSLLGAALVAAACFVIVAVGAYGLQFGEEVRRLDSGAGGYGLVARSAVPLIQDLSSDDGRFDLGFSDRDSALVETAEIVPYRLVPGEDMSCLNLYQPTEPGLLGVPREQIERGGFEFSAVESDLLSDSGDADDSQAVWSLLDLDLGPGVLPVIGDANSVLWILKSRLGGEIEIDDEQGDPLRLRIVALLDRSLFRSELLVAEDRLLDHFPSRTGHSYFLIDAPAENEAEIAGVLEEELGSWGFDVQATPDVLQSYQAVENTYLSTFQTLGGLGLLLGTIGLAVVLLRNVAERRGELATMRALGFRRRRLGWLVVAENTLVLLAGIGIGSLAALVAVVPHLRGASAHVPWVSLSLTLAAVAIFGTLASVLAVRRALDAPLITALRAEG